jgi:hypothetical protein
MEQVWFVAALWLFLALVAVLVANWLRVSTALSEIVVGTVAQLAIGALAGGEALGAKAPWITFLAGTGAIWPAPSWIPMFSARNGRNHPWSVWSDSSVLFLAPR